MPPNPRRILQAVFSPKLPGPTPAKVEQMQDRLLRTYRRQYAGRDHRRWPALALRGVMVAVLAGGVIGACRLPAEYTVAVGNRVAVILDANQADDLNLEQMQHFIRTHYEVERIGLRVQQQLIVEDGESSAVVRLDLDIVADDVHVVNMWNDMVAEFPALEGARVTDEPLNASVEGTIGGFLSHEYLDLLIDRRGAEDAKQRLLAEIAAHGFTGDVYVDVQSQPGRREVRVELRQDSDHVAGGTDDG